MPRDATLTRERLLRAGERLFAEDRIDAVRVREINQLARQRNSSALHYHFGSREGLLDAILARHRDPIEAARAEMLDELERVGRTDDLRALVETLVVPFAGQLATESGRDYLRIIPQLIGRRDLPVGAVPDAFGPLGIRRTLRYAHRCLPELAPLLREERLALAMEFVSQMVARRAYDIELDVAVRLSEDHFMANVVDMTVGMLKAPTTTALPAAAH